MDLVFDLVKVLENKKFQKSEIVDKLILSTTENVYGNFYAAIANNDIKNTDEAIAFLYGKINKENINKYRQFKFRFKRKLLNTLFFVDVANVDFKNNIQKTYFEGIKTMFQVDIIQKYGGNNNLVKEIILDNINTIKKYKLNYILSEYSLKLINYYTLNGDYKSLAKEIKNYNNYNQLYLEETNAFILFNEVNVLAGSPKPNTKLLLTKLPVLNEIIVKAKSNLSKSYAMMAKIIYYEYFANYKECMAVCFETLKILNKSESLVKQSYTAIVNYFIVRMHFQLKNFNQCKTYINSINGKMLGYNWFLINEINFKLELNLDNLTQAKLVYNKVINHKLYNALPERVIEMWNLHLFYLDFYQSIKKNEPFNQNVFTLINSSTNLYHDKSEFNFSLIIIKILYLLYKQKYTEASKVIGTLRVYRSRYLKGKKYNRPKQFIEELILLDKNNYEKKISKTHFLQKSDSNIILDSEIILYENLIDIINTMLYPTSNPSH
ncbi:MAG: hypothetical protein R2801_00195 [Chitinophagales bacterium]